MSTKRYRAEEHGSAMAMMWRDVAADTPPFRRPHLDSVLTEELGRRAAPDLEQELRAQITLAREQGREEGEIAGMRAAASKIEPALQQWNALLAELVRVRAKVRQEAEEDVVKLATAIARRVVHRELTTDPEAILGLVKAAFGRLNSREGHALRISTSDAAVIEQNRLRLQLPPGLEIIADPSLRAGSVIFETSRGDFDASVETQLTEIERGLADTLARKRKM